MPKSKEFNYDVLCKAQIIMAAKFEKSFGKYQVLHTST